MNCASRRCYRLARRPCQIYIRTGGVLSSAGRRFCGTLRGHWWLFPRCSLFDGVHSGHEILFPVARPERVGVHPILPTLAWQIAAFTFFGPFSSGITRMTEAIDMCLFRRSCLRGQQLLYRPPRKSLLAFCDILIASPPAKLRLADPVLGMGFHPQRHAFFPVGS